MGKNTFWRCNSNHDSNEYIQLNSDGTAIVSYETGGGPAKINDSMTYQLTYYKGGFDPVILELYSESGPTPVCTMMIGYKMDGIYKFSVTESTPGSNLGDLDFIKE